MAATDHHKTNPGSAGDPDWENRVLCSDESCIGVIGPDGRCRVCGRPAEPGTRIPPDHDSIGAAAPFAEPALAPETEPDPGAGDTPSDPDLTWEDRVLCSDESCIGVIGPDGRCRVCGKPHVSPDV